MAKRRTKRAKQRAERKVSKREAMARGDRSDNLKSKYRERVAARRRGVPMASRSGERSPWWASIPRLLLPVPEHVQAQLAEAA